MNFMPSPATMPSEGLQIQEDREELCQGTDIQYAHPYGSCRHLLRQATCKKGRPCARPWRTMPIPTRSGGSWAGQRRRPGPGLSSISPPGHASAPAGSTAGDPRGCPSKSSANKQDTKGLFFLFASANHILYNSEDTLFTRRVLCGVWAPINHHLPGGAGTTISRTGLVRG